MVFLDDILITVHTDEEHLWNLQEVLERLGKLWLRPKHDKCQFLHNIFDYLGYCIDKTGLHIMSSKVATIIKAPMPKNVHKFQLF